MSFDVLDVRPARVLGEHRDDLVVAAGLVAHLQHADGTHAGEHAGGQIEVEQHQHVERVAVLAEGVLEEAVVRGVPERRVQDAVEEHAAGAVVDLVLDAAAAGDLDDGVVRAHVVLLRRDGWDAATSLVAGHTAFRLRSLRSR